MKAPRRARRGLRIETRLPKNEVEALAKQAADSVKPDWLISGSTIRYEGHQGQRLNFSVNSLGKRLERATFYVNIASSNGRTLIEMALDSCKVSQSKFLMVIPAGPKTVTGYHAFHGFEQMFEQQIRSADPQVTVQAVDDLAQLD